MNRLSGQEERNQFPERPDVIGKPSFHRWRYSQRLVNAAKVVVHVVQRNCVTVILKFLAESVCQAREALT
jgi:hypothetical protein